MKSSQAFINEIDGLRAIAVIAVLLFHTFGEVFPGGFVGVDIFFVISGFVISRTYLSDLIDRKVTLSHFYIKRVRRLAPAYLIVLVVSFVCAYFLLGPNSLNSFSKTLLAQPFYVQNFVFWLEGDYFDKAFSKPLLHTWSLAVEEQFYLAFGLLIIFFRWKRDLVLPVLLLMLVTSVLLGHLIAESSPKTSFFLLITRMWEFAIGFLAYLSTQKIDKQSGNKWTNWLYFLSIIGVLSSIVMFDERAAFPGVQSILACTATFFLLVLFEARPSKYYSGFSYAPLRYTGKLSYSLYLWHWPIIVYFMSFLQRELHWYEAVCAIVMAFILSAMTYQWVENPIRRKSILPSTRSLLRYWGASSVLIIIVGAGFVWTNGALFRYENQEVRTLLLAAQDRSPYRCSKLSRIFNPTSEICKINDAVGKSGVLIIGDSHADQLDEMIAELGKAKNIPVYLTVRNCTSDEFGANAHCAKSILAEILAEIKRNNITTVISTSYWRPESLNINGFSEYLEILTDAGLKIYISETVPSSDYFNPTLLAKHLLQEPSFVRKPFSKSDYNRETEEIHLTLKLFENEFPDAVQILKPGDYLCDVGACDFYTNGYPNYFDSHHLTRVGVDRLKPMYSLIFKSVQ
ncbi:MAG: peptidoglycan/LPS O-acetylase OafA/YrhL [Gammaproteobacteria bacterium]|jgi:peptidoglycan/LPS O-acetylase OafA/YrhL